jgi:hypothetical protein
VALTIKKIPTSYLTPNRALPKREVYDAFVANPKATRLLTYGGREILGAATAHDHAEDGGEVLRDRSRLSVMFGPQGREFAGIVPKIGINLLPPQGAGDFVASPKLVASGPVLFPGGVKQVSGRLRIFYDTTDPITIYVGIRPYSALNYKFGFGALLYQTIAYTPSLPASYRGLAFTFPALDDMGGVEFDRELEVCLWQGYNPGAGSGHRLCDIYLSPGAAGVATAAGRAAKRRDPGLVSVSTAEVLQGAHLDTQLTNKIRQRVNQELSGLLGLAPGVMPDGRTPDRTRPYTQEVQGAKQHQGALVPDGSGGFFCDGACLREQRAVQWYPRNLGENAGGTAVTGNPYLGPEIHPSGALDGQWGRWKFRASLEAGLTALWIRFALRIATIDVHTTCKAHVGVLDFSGANIAKRITSELHSSSGTDADGLLVCQVDPLDNDAYQRGQDRRRAGKGIWTGDGLLLDASLNPPAGIQGPPYQASELVQVELSHPAVRPTDSPHKTQDYMIVFRAELATLDSGNYDPSTRLQWFHAMTPRLP